MRASLLDKSAIHRFLECVFCEFSARDVEAPSRSGRLGTNRAEEDAGAEAGFQDASSAVAKHPACHDQCGIGAGVVGSELPLK